MANNYSDRRVVVTGMGVVTPLGHDLDVFWKNLISGQCGIDKITAFDASAFDTQIAGEVKNFDPTPAFPSPKEIRRTDRYSQFGVYACAGARSKIPAWNWKRKICDEIGVFLGSGIGGLATTSEQHKILLERGPGRMSPFMIPMLIGNMASGLVLDVFQPARPELRHLLRLRHREPRHRRSLAHHQDGRRAT
jgi:3-oxoacyl-[acyl-carrier-protein] synthase II